MSANASNPDEIKRAKTEHPVLPAIAARWSPYRYQPKPVEADKLKICFEAARWAASSYNEQPWIFFVAKRESTADFQKALGCLDPANQGWAAAAGVLILTAVRKSFSRNNTPNRVALHDLGIAAGQFSIQAAALGLQAHQMAGVNLSAVRQQYSIPEAYEPATAIALGYADLSPAPANDQMAPRDLAPRGRKAFSEFIFADQFGSPANL